MSFFPTEEVRCGPLKPRKYPVGVIGTAGARLGYRVRERSNCRLVKLPETYGHLEDEKDREYEHLAKIQEFQDVTDKRIKRQNVRTRVRQGLAAYEDTVNARRVKLQEMLFKEEAELIREAMDQEQRGDDARMDEMRRKTEEIHKEKEEKRLAMVAAKRMQQLLTKCPEFRARLAKKFTIEAKQSNLAQMADNEAKRQAERELDNLWHELMLKEVEAKKDREEEEARKRFLVERGSLDDLERQVAGKLALQEYKKQVQKEDREYLDELWEKLRREEAENLEKERQKRERLKNELQEQIMIAKRRLAEQARHEAELDRLRSTIAAEELAKERESIKASSEALRKELLAYLQYLEDVRKEEARREMEVDRIVEQSQKDVATRRDLAVQKFKEIKERSVREVLRGREEQLRMKREKEKQESEECEREAEAMKMRAEMEAKLAAQYEAERKNKVLRYKKDLEEQWKQEEERRKGSEEEERARLETLKREEEEQHGLMDELMRASENITPHPFKVLLKECAARTSAEREGRCCCPPPSNEELES